MGNILHDVRYVIRQLRKNPSFTAIAVITLTLGIAINATMFSLVSAILLRRPPGRDPDRIAVVTTIDPSGGFQADISAVSVPNYLAWRENNSVFSEMAAADMYRTVGLTSERQSEALRSAAVSANFFNVLGSSAEQGRTFAPGEDRTGQDHVIILSHSLWQRRFGADPSIVGRPIRLNRENYTVIGVMPASFRMLGFTPELWTPLTITSADQTAAARRDRSLLLFARMKPGVTLAQARSEFATLAARERASFPDSEKGWGATVRTLPDFLVYGFGIRSGLAVIMTTVGFVLMIACANVSGLLLARAAARRKEIAIRFSLGAKRLRIVRQLLIEGFAIALLGGAAGVLLAYRGIAFVRSSMQFNDAIAAIDLRLDSNVVLFSTAISVACALLCALIPALNASRTDVATSLKDESRTASAGRSHSRVRRIIVTGEIALALFLLIGTGLLFVSIFRTEHQNLGFPPDHLLTANVTLDNAKYKDDGQKIAFVRNLLPRLQDMPGAQAAAATSELPASLFNRVGFQIEGEPDLPPGQTQTALDEVVTPDYLRTTQIPLIQGRPFSPSDTAASAPVLLVNQKFVERFLHGKEPLGQRLRLQVNGATSGWAEVVGVVGNVKSYSESPREDPAIFESYLQRPIPSFFLVVRTTTDPNALISTMRNEVANVDSELPLAQFQTMVAVVEKQKYGDAFFSNALGAFAALALILAAIGIYGLIAYSVGQRNHEIGIRMAMGAKSQDVLRMVLREGLIMTVIGAAIGFALSIPLPKVFSAIFVDLQANEPRIYLLVPMLTLFIAVLATYIPARRAARVDPVRALRQE
jgi:putative ABC transport system permease protein